MCKLLKQEFAISYLNNVANEIYTTNSNKHNHGTSHMSRPIARVRNQTLKLNTNQQSHLLSVKQNNKS